MFQYAGPADAAVKYHLTQTEKAFYIAFQAHYGQTDKGGRSYIYHPLSLCYILTGTPCNSPLLLQDHYLNQEPLILHSLLDCEIMTAALLHDVVEDTDMTLEELRSFGLPDFSVSLVALLTRQKEEDYSAYIDRIASNPYACLIKTADLLHNCNLNRLPVISRNDLLRRDKYISVIRRLWPLIQASGIPCSIALPEEYLPAPVLS